MSILYRAESQNELPMTGTSANLTKITTTGSLTNTPVTIAASTSAAATVPSSSTGQLSDLPNAPYTTLASQTSSPPSHPKAGLAAGAVAGIGVGSLIAGILISLGAVCLFMRRRGRGVGSREYGSSSDDSGPIVELQENVLPKKGHDNGAPGPEALPLEQILLESVSNSDAGRDMQVMCTQIEQHVANNYNQKSWKGNLNDLVQALNSSGYQGTGISTEDLAAVLVDKTSRSAAICHFIAWLIFTRVSGSSRAEVSLLPGPIAEIVLAMPPAEASAMNHDVFDRAFSIWRSTTAFLLQTSRQARTRLRPDEAELKPAIDRNIALLDKVLQSFSNPGKRAKEQQETNLRAIMLKSASFGLVLFSQPTSWSFDWKAGNEMANSSTATKIKARSSLVVFPALVRSARSDGIRSAGIKVIVEAEVMGW